MNATCEVCGGPITSGHATGGFTVWLHHNDADVYAFPHAGYPAEITATTKIRGAEIVDKGWTGRPVRGDEGPIE